MIWATQLGHRAVPIALGFGTLLLREKKSGDEQVTPAYDTLCVVVLLNEQFPNKKEKERP